MPRSLMRTCKIGIVTMLLVGASTLTYAVFDATTVSGGSTDAAAANLNAAILSPSDFTKKVGALKQQAKQSLSAQTTQFLATPTKGSATPPGAHATPTPPPTPASFSTPTPGTDNSQEYTGFGNNPSTNTAPSAAPSSESGSSWSIKY